ncbi:MAG: hypothetical protein ACI80S_000918 [Pseudohongiellaceae bacterium]|jgi:hypothetical protein
MSLAKAIAVYYASFANVTALFLFNGMVVTVMWVC